jgi:hypothetical protein
MAEFSPKRDTMERHFMDELAARKFGNSKQKKQFSEKCFSEEMKQTVVWVKEIGNLARESRNAFYYDFMLGSINRAANFPLE